MSAIKTLLFIPTYNERENVHTIYRQIKELQLDFDLLFVDDNSPDGTGKLLDQIAQQDPRLRVIHRPDKLGIGTAHLQAIEWAYQHGYEILISMDCDLTHPTDHIPDLLQYADQFDVVLGSRFMRTVSLAEWNPVRKFLTHFGHFLTRYLLQIPYDATGGFRLYRLDRINPKVFNLVKSTGYSFFFESLYILCLSGAHVKEVPIVLPKRTYGHSKMRFADILASLRRLVILYLRSFQYKARLRELAARTTEKAYHAGS